MKDFFVIKIFLENYFGKIILKIFLKNEETKNSKPKCKFFHFPVKFLDLAVIFLFLCDFVGLMEILLDFSLLGSHGLSVQRVRRTKSSRPKSRQLEVGEWTSDIC